MTIIAELPFHWCCFHFAGLSKVLHPCIRCTHPGNCVSHISAILNAAMALIDISMFILGFCWFFLKPFSSPFRMPCFFSFRKCERPDAPRIEEPSTSSETKVLPRLVALGFLVKLGHGHPLLHGLLA